MASAEYATARVNGTTSPSLAEDEELYSELLKLRDIVVSGKHASIKLPPAAIERLRASLIVPDAQSWDSQQSPWIGAINGSAFATNQVQPQQSLPFPQCSDLPGLKPSSIPHANGTTQSSGANRPVAAGLDPIFLEKSDNLVRAEGQLKRQRLDRDLQAQVEQRKHSSRDKDPGAEAPSPIDIDFVLLTALERVKPISGLKDGEKSGASSSFDENDYYSSQVQSDWSSEPSSSKASDEAAGAFTADFERLDGAPPKITSFAQRSSHRKEPSLPGTAPLQQTSKDRPHVYTNVPEDVYEIAEDDDEYTPPDATAFDGFRNDGTGMDMDPITPPDDDNSDYEPGEITDTNIPSPEYRVEEPSQPSPRVPVIRNHLTHIVAPQPNRVSPLATAKGPSLELELVNGRPEVVQKPRNHQNMVHSRASTASPSANGVGGSGKKKRNKKRKRDVEPAGRNKRRREKQAVVDPHAPPPYDEPYIKDEPISPPPFANLPHVPPYGQSHAQQPPVDVDLSSPRYAPQVQYAKEYPRSGLRYEHVQPASPTFVQGPSPTAQRPAQRDTEDLRRVASLHVAQRLPSPQQRAFSPVAPYRTASMAYDDPQQRQAPSPIADRVAARYQEQPIPEYGHHIRDERSRSPPRPQEYRESYVARAQSPALMPPPVSQPRKIVVDQNGNRYYAAEAAPASTPVQTTRTSVAPFERRQQPDLSYERLPTHTAVSYGQLTPTQASQYGFADGRMPPPAPPSRRQVIPEQRVSHIDASGYYAQDYGTHPSEQTRYTEMPTSPIYQQVRAYEQVPTSLQASREPTSSVYVPTRSYSVRAEDPSKVLRHASVAPVQYVRRDAPAPGRAVSVMPASDYGAVSAQQQQYQRTYSQAPQVPQAPVRYVDQHGNEVFPREVRHVNEYRY